VKDKMGSRRTGPALISRKGTPSFYDQDGVGYAKHSVLSAQLSRKGSMALSVFLNPRLSSITYASLSLLPVDLRAVLE